MCPGGVAGDDARPVLPEQAWPVDQRPTCLRHGGGFAGLADPRVRKTGAEGISAIFTGPLASEQASPQKAKTA